MPFYVQFEDNAAIAEVTQESDLVDFLLYVLEDNLRENEKVTISGYPKQQYQMPTRFSWKFCIDAREGMAIK